VRHRRPRALALLPVLVATLLAGALVPAARVPVAEAATTAVYLVGAGDIASCGMSGDSRTAALVQSLSGTVATFGDNAYESGTAAQFADCYAPTWGAFLSRTRPSAGNHDYGTAGAAGYFGYFGTRAGRVGRGYYAYDLGAWRIYVLNSNCGQVSCAVGSAQERWLRADLAAYPHRCVLAYWHHPLFSSGVHGNTSAVRPLFQALYDAGAELVLNGHDHDYERFAPQSAWGTATSRGIREIVVGTGGASLRSFGTVKRNSVARGIGYGVIRLALRSDGYSWRFHPAAGSTYADSGSAYCH
jgi:hypothetical protein